MASKIAEQAVQPPSTPPAIEPADKSLAEGLADSIEYDIATSKLSEKLTESDLAQRFSTSRSTIREAFRILQSRGVIDLVRGRGAIVRPFSSKMIVDGFAVNAVLAGLASRIVATEFSRASMPELQYRLRRVEDLMADGPADPVAFARGIGILFSQITQASRNEMIASNQAQFFERSAWVRLWEHGWDYLTLERQQAAARDLGSILAAIKSGDGHMADMLSRQFLELYGNNVLHNLAHQRGEPTGLSIVSLTENEADVDVSRDGHLERRVAALEAAVRDLKAGR